MHPRRRSHLNARVTWVVLVLRPEYPDAGAYPGSEKISGYMRRFLEGWDHAAIEGEEFIAAGESVVVRVHQQASGVKTGIPVDMRYSRSGPLRGVR